jgi:predicted Zn-dependent protease
MTNLSQSPSDHIPTWYGEAQEARNAGDIATAQAAVERILEHDPGRPGALYLCGLLALDSNQFEAAQSWLERQEHCLYRGFSTNALRLVLPSAIAICCASVCSNSIRITCKRCD